MSKRDDINALIGDAMPAILGCVRNLEFDYHQRDTLSAKINLISLINVASRSLLKIETKEQADEADSTA